MLGCGYYGASYPGAWEGGEVPWSSHVWGWGDWRPFSCLVQHYKCMCWRGVGAHRLFLVPHSSQRPLAPFSPWHSPSAFSMDPGKRPTGDASGEGWSTRCHLMGVGSSSGGRRRRGLPLAMSLEPTQPSDVASAATAETEVERLRRYYRSPKPLLRRWNRRCGPFETSR
jgi:hypothetical protein